MTSDTAPKVTDLVNGETMTTLVVTMPEEQEAWILDASGAPLARVCIMRVKGGRARVAITARKSMRIERVRGTPNG